MRKRKYHLPKHGAPLTLAQLEVVRLRAQGYTMKDMATTLHLSLHSICDRWRGVTYKLGMFDPVQIVLWWQRQQQAKR